jgi:tRNA threonylcarbamoyl adenosine modification protein (Sua5/YciO/YrdC/YwlC family)
MAEMLAAEISKDFELLAEKFWPGPLTIIVRASSRLPLRVTANTGNVALRVPAAEIPISIIKKAGFPITATSANLSGESECTTASEVREQLGDRIPLIVDGGTSPRTVASTIVDLSSADGDWRVIRPGAISVDDVTAVLG